MWGVLVALLFTLGIAQAADKLDIYDEGLFKGTYEGINFVGAGAVCGGPPPLAVCTISGGGAGGGDSITVDSLDTTDPNFSDAGDINFTYSAPNITAEVKPNSVDLTTDTVGNYLADIIGPGLRKSGTEGALAEIGYSAALTDNVAFNAGMAVFSDDCPGGGFLTEGNTGSNTNEMLMCFPSLDEADTTHILVTESASQVLTNKTLANFNNSLDLDAGVTVTGIVDDQVVVGTGAGTTAYVTLQNCNDVTEKLDWTGAAFACVADQTGVGGGDAVTVDGAPTTDPNFDDGGDINFAYAAPNITATVKANSVELNTDTTGPYIQDVLGPGLRQSGTEAATAELGYAGTLAGNPVLAIGEMVFTAACPGGGFLSEGNATGNNEQMFCFPSSDGVDTTQTIALTDTEPGGTTDVTGSLSAGYQVTDNSHAHDGTTISGLDAGDTTTGIFADARVDGSLEANELVLAGDVDGTADTNDLDEAAVETELEAVLDLANLQDHDIDSLSGQGNWGSAVTKETNSIIYNGVEADFETGAAEGYPRLGQSTTPPAAACDAAGEAGRLYFDTDADTDGSVFVCRGATGWKDIDDDGGAGGGTMSTWTMTGDTGTMDITDSETVDVEGGNGVVTTATTGTPERMTIALDGYYYITNNVTDCAGASDQTTNVNTALSTATAAGLAVLVPSGCRIGLASPGAGANSIDVPAGATIIGEDLSAEFFAVHQYCTGGTYEGAHCATGADCLGGGSCVFDFGSTKYAPTGGSDYIMFQDTAAGSGITIKNLTINTYQSDNYQACSGGTNSGRSCRQECAGGALVGVRCEKDGDCPSSTCANLTDCDDASSPDAAVDNLSVNCTGSPVSTSGAGNITVFDLARTSGVLLENVRVNDHYTGDFTAIVGNSATIRNSDLSASADNCTTPMTSTPATSFCRVGLAGLCCNGAANPFGNGTNVQPTNAVAVGVEAGAFALIEGAGAKGVIAYNLTTTNPSTIRYSRTMPNGINGPGTPGTTGIKVTGNGSIVKGNTIVGSATTQGIIAGVNGSNISNVKITDNTIESSPVDTMDEGIFISATGGQVTGNTITSTEKYGIHTNDTGQVRFEDNNITLNSTSFITNTFKPIGLYFDGDLSIFASQNTVEANHFIGGWHGVDHSSGDTTYNINLANNRFIAQAGSAWTTNSAGNQFVGNYINQATSSSYPSTVCDPVCTGGTVARGQPCVEDDDCLGTCTGVTNECTLEPASWIGNPSAKTGASHAALKDNILFAQSGVFGQCGGAGVTNAGQICTTTGDTCAGGATCSGAPATCQTGTDQGKRCCTGGGSQTCNKTTRREPLRSVRFVDAAHSEIGIDGNHIMTADSHDYVGADLNASVANAVSCVGCSLSGNNVYSGNASPTNTTGFIFGTGSSNADMKFSDNLFWQINTDVTGWKGAFGYGSFPPCTVSIGPSNEQVVTSTTFVDVAALGCPVKANRTYSIQCHVLVVASAATEAYLGSIHGPTSPTIFSGQITQCGAAGGCLSQGTDNYVSIHFNADDVAVNIGTQGSTSVTGFLVTGILSNGSNAGTVVPRVKTETGGGNSTTVKQGSYCMVQQVPIGN